MKADPGSIRAGASGSGSIHHLNLLGFENGSGADLNFIPYDGSAPAQNAAMTGEITVIITSVAEQAELIRGGKLRPLGMMTPDSFDLDGTVIPSAFDEAMASDEVKNFGKEKYYILSGKRGAEANAVFAALESNFAWTLWELGAADVNPEDLNIPKP